MLPPLGWYLLEAEQLCTHLEGQPGNVSQPFGMERSFCVAHSLKTTTMLSWTWYSANSLCEFGLCNMPGSASRVVCKMCTYILDPHYIWIANVCSKSKLRQGRKNWLTFEWELMQQPNPIDLVSVNLPPATWPVTITIRPVTINSPSVLLALCIITVKI